MDNAIALIMAGGRSERMRQTSGLTHKSLVQVAGVSLIERNLLALIAQGFLTIEVVFNVSEQMISDEIKHKLTFLAHKHGAVLRSRTEKTPLGNIGILQEFEGYSGDLLITYVDNLSTIDLQNMLLHHREMKAALTIAVHRQRVQLPFGQVVVRDGTIIQYHEKPTIQATVSSGFFVIKTTAARYIEKGQRIDIAQFFDLISKADERIVAFPHDSLWIDINDQAMLKSAEELIRVNPDAFRALIP